ncbi:hypothetical protein JCM6882_000129 [Rhodosporidiobolus microsporus]
MSSLFNSDSSFLDNPTLSSASSFANGGGPVIAITAKDSIVVLAIPRKPESRLQGEEATRKVWTVKEFTRGNKWAFAFSGFVPDAHALRKVAMREPGSTVRLLAASVAEVQYNRLSSTTSRPMAVSSLLCGFDSTSSENPAPPQLFHIAPSSLLTSILACALGSQHEAHQRILDERWREGMDTKEAIELAVDCVIRTGEGRELERMEVTVVETEKGIRKLTPEELALHLPPSTIPSRGTGPIALPLSSSAHHQTDLLAPSDDEDEDDSPLPLARVSRALSGLVDAMTEQPIRTAGGKEADGGEYMSPTDHLS